MELHLALRNIVKTDGPAIITEGRLVNILCDFQAFDAIPASKYVMRAIIDDGYAKKLLQCSKWDINAQQLSGQFANSTGFQQDIVWTIFQSLAYGLGWISEIKEFVVSNNNQVSKKQSSKANAKSVDLLCDLVDIKNAQFSSNGISISNISFQESGSYIIGYAEVDGKKISSLPQIHAAIFCGNEIIADEFNYYKGFEIMKFYFMESKTRINEITKIVFYVRE